MKSTVIIVALAIVLLAVIANHGCESATAEDRTLSSDGQFCTSLKERCDGLASRRFLNWICTRVYNLFCSS